MAILDDTRADWNARPPLRPRTTVAWSDRIGVSWHWIGPGRGPSAGGPHQKCLDQVRDWQYQHQHKPPPDGPWKDIGYNVLICQHARTIEGRGLEFSGSHSPGVNTSHVGVQFMVGEAGDPPTTAMLARAVRLRADIGALGKNIRRDWAHRDDPDAATGCPGNWIATWVHTGGPTKNAPTSPEEDDMPTTDEIVKGVMAAKVIPANMLVTDPDPDAPNLVTVPRALDLMLRWSLEGRDASLRGEAIAKALAEKGEALTPAEIDAIGNAVGEKLAGGFDVNLTPKAGA